MIIAHRGCTIGPDKEYENSESFIINALNKGFYIECDIWLIDNQLFLGHDKPTYETSLKFIDNDKFFIHAKNLSAFDYLLKNIKYADVFFHDKDLYTLTKNKIIWTNINQPFNENCIVVMPELSNFTKDELKIAKGICTDYPFEYL